MRLRTVPGYQPLQTDFAKVESIEIVGPQSFTDVLQGMLDAKAGVDSAYKTGENFALAESALGIKAAKYALKQGLAVKVQSSDPSNLWRWERYYVPIRGKYFFFTVTTIDGKEKYLWD